MNLKPCPFCGGTPETDLSRGFIDYKSKSANAVAIYCLACEAEFCLCYGDFSEYTPIQLMEIIVERWNKRTPITLGMDANYSRNQSNRQIL